MMSLFNSKERTFQEWVDMGCVSSSRARSPVLLFSCSLLFCRSSSFRPLRRLRRFVVLNVRVYLCMCRTQAGFKFVKVWDAGEASLVEFTVA